MRDECNDMVSPFVRGRMIADYLRDARTKAAMTQPEAAADVSGINLRQLQRYEGNDCFPPEENILQLAESYKAYLMPLECLMTSNLWRYCLPALKLADDNGSLQRLTCAVAAIHKDIDVLVECSVKNIPITERDEWLRMEPYIETLCASALEVLAQGKKKRREEDD